MPVPTHGPMCSTKTYPAHCASCKRKIFYFSCSCGSRVFFESLDTFEYHGCSEAVGARQSSRTALTISMQSPDRGSFQAAVTSAVRRWQSSGVLLSGPSRVNSSEYVVRVKPSTTSPEVVGPLTDLFLEKVNFRLQWEVD